MNNAQQEKGLVASPEIKQPKSVRITKAVGGFIVTQEGFGHYGGQSSVFTDTWGMNEFVNDYLNNEN